MKTNSIKFAFLLFFFCFVNVLLGQEYSDWQQSQIDEEYFGNKDFYKAVYDYEIEVEESRSILKNVVDHFEKEKNWKAFIKANTELTKTYHSYSNFQEGVEIGEQAFKKIKKQAPEFRQDCGRLIYNIGLTYPYPHATEAAIEKFSYAKNLVKNHSQVDTLLLGNIYYSLGLGMKHLNKLENAEHYLLQSKENLESISSFDTCEVGWVKGNYGARTDTVINENGDMITYHLAGVLTLEIFNDCQDYLTALANAYTNLGDIYRKKRDYKKALEFLDKGLERKGAAHQKHDEIYFLNHYYHLGLYFFDLEDYETSNKYFNKIIRIIESEGFFKYEKDDIKFKKVFLNNKLQPECYYYVAENLFHLDQINDAIQNYENALALIDKNQDELDLKLKIYTGLGRLSSRYNLVESHGYDAKSLFRFVDSAILNNQPLAQLKEVEVSTKVNYNLEKAEVLMWNYYDEKKQIYFSYYKTKEAIDELKKTFELIPTNKYEILRAKINLSLARNYFIFEGRDPKISADSALYYSHRALINVSKKFNSTDIYQLPELDDLIDYPIVQKVLLQKVNLIIEKHGLPDDDEARQQVVEFFSSNKFDEDSEFYDEYNELLNSFRFLFKLFDLADEFHDQHLKESYFLRVGNNDDFANQSIELYHHGIFAAYFYNVFTNSDEMIKKAFYYTQKMKGQKLLLATLKNEALYQAQIDSLYLEKEKELNIKITNLENFLFGDNIRDFGFYKDDYEFIELYKSRRELEKLQKEIYATYPDYYQSKYNFIPETYESIQKLLKEDEILIEYVLTCCELFIITMSKNELPQITESSRDDNTGYYVFQLKKMLENSTMMRRSTREKFIEMNHDLYRNIIQPIEDKIANKKRLIIIPDESIHYVPIEMLLSSEKVKPYHKLDYLINSHEVSYHYSIPLFAKARRKTKKDNKGIYAFAPVYDDGNSEMDLAENSTRDNDGWNFRAYDNNGNFSTLPYSEKEVIAIAKLFNKKSNSSNNTLALRLNASETELKTNVEKPYQFIHIAGHSFANIIDSRFSGIACYKTPIDYENDGVLYTSEIYNLSAKADLITLSSCESGGGELDGSDGIMGLNRAFIYAGTSNVVFSQWKVYDKVNAKLMVDFYKNVLSGNNYSTSLRNAKLKLLQKESTASPHFWSPYLLIGR